MKKSLLIIIAVAIIIAYALLVNVLISLSSNAAELPSFVTANARKACESDVRYYCKITNATTYNRIKVCIKNNWEKLSNDCQYEIVSLLPQIEEYEKRRIKSQ